MTTPEVLARVVAVCRTKHYSFTGVASPLDSLPGQIIPFASAAPIRAHSRDSRAHSVA